MSWIEKLLPPRINKTSDSGARRVPEGLWVKCPSCESVLYSEDLAANLHVCPKCDHHMRIGARARIDSLLDVEGRVEIGQTTRSVDSLKFKDTRKYPERLQEAVKQTGGTGKITIELTIKPVPNIDGTFSVADKITHTVPKEPRKSMWFATKDGGLTREQPGLYGPIAANTMPAPDGKSAGAGHD